jgi:hypothetical protein
MLIIVRLTDVFFNNKKPTNMYLNYLFDFKDNYSKIKALSLPIVVLRKNKTSEG